MPLVADSNGVLSGKFTIPANVRAGTKDFTVVGQGGSTGSAVFVGQGTLSTDMLQTITTVTTTREIDPLAQTFSLPVEAQVGGVDVWVVAKGTSPIIVQIRETLVGFPTGTILAEGRLDPSAITVGAFNRFLFDAPIRLAANNELAIVVLCNDPIGSIGVAELGKFDSTQQQWVTNQPYQIGVLLSSSNASTWTTHQDRDMTFRLLARRYSSATREISLGSVAVTNATDLVVLSMAEDVATGADSDIVLTLPDGTSRSAGDGQTVTFTAGITGNIGVTARLRANQMVSAILRPGTQLAAGTIQLTGNYISRAMPADAAGANVRIIFNADIPSGSTVLVFVSGTDAGDAWLPVTQVGTAKPLGDGIYEFEYVYTGLHEAAVRVKLQFTGTATARPKFYNLRVSTTAAS